ncbi:phosphatase PAP2 family protein [Streptomyces avicenniae]|uniref:phosphatase PAP2 family protein n=1 Tax=Streptomyces avicenniae TaxID=500153 RepID=UPI00069C18E2|nr:phosphatase PAP2 family protein [Streptomyces avicenniae]
MTRSHRVTIAAVAAALLAALMFAVALRDGAPFPVDDTLHDEALERRTGGWNDAFRFITSTGSGVPPLVIAAVVGALYVPRTWWLGAVAGVGALAVGQLVRLLIVTTFDRPRPPVADWLIHVNNPSMPSGHAATSGMVAIGVAVLLARHLPRAVAYGVPAVWAVAVGVSRVYLGVHWPSDILAGWLYATVAACVLLPPLGAALARAGRRSAVPPVDHADRF